MDEMDSLLVRLAKSSDESKEARLIIYRDILDKGVSTDDTDSSSKARAFENRRGPILPILVNDSRQGSCVQHSALELLTHLCAMASSWEAPAFQAFQASSLWGAVAKVLDDEASSRMVRATALFAVVKQTMEARLVEPSVEQLARGVARSMGHTSTVIRKTSAEAVHALLGAAPRAMARCARCTAVASSEEENSCWVRGLLQLCLDDAVGVRESALVAAARAVSSGNLRGNAGIAAWILGNLRDGTLDRALQRVVLGSAESRSPPAPAPPAAAKAPTKGSNGSNVHPSSPPSTEAEASAHKKPRRAKQHKQQLVNHALKAWAAHLSLVDPDSLLQRLNEGEKRLLDDGTAIFSRLSNKLGDKREAVRIQAVEAWEMFTKSMVAQCSLDPKQTQAEKLAHMFLSVLARLVDKETSAPVRAATMSAIAGLAASFPSPLFRHLWEPRSSNRKRGKGGKDGSLQGLADVLRGVTERDKSVNSRHYCAQLLANLLPCFCLGPADSHPSLRESRIDLAKEMPRLLFIFESLMKGKGQDSAAPVPVDVASMIDAMAPPPLSLSSSRPSGGSSAATRLEVLPTDGLIANAWCGLAFWAMERATTALATAAASPPVAATIEANADNKDGDDSGKRKGKGKAKEGSVTAAEGGRPLLVLLRWLLGGATESSNGGGTNEESAAGGSSAAEEAASTPTTSVVSTQILASWKASLLGALIRGLSRRLALSRIRTAPGSATDDSGAKRTLRGPEEPPEQAWLVTPVDVPLLSSGGSSACPECALAGNIIRAAHVNLTKEGEQDGEERQEKPPPSRFPLWFVLVEALLRGECGWNKYGGGDRRCHPGPLLPQVLSAEALALSPSGWSAGLLEPLYKGAFCETEGGDHGTRAVEPGEGDVHGSSGARGVVSAKRRQEEQSSALTVLSHAWRAEASRVLLAWKRGRLPRPDSSSPGGTTGMGVGGSVQEAGLLHNGSTAGEPARQEFSDELRLDTGNTLVLLLRTASSLLSRPSPPKCNRSRGEARGRAAVVEDVCVSGGKTPAHGGGQGEACEREGEVQEALHVSNQNLEQGGGGGGATQGWSQGGRRLAAAKAILGAESAGLWGEVFEARRNSRTNAEGFTRLVKHLSKACGSCALSAEKPEQAVVGSGASGGNAAILKGAWGLGFSQTQTQSQSQQDTGAGASTSEGRKSTPAAATATRDNLAPPPPLFSVPVLAAAALALVRAAPEETKLRERERAWKAGLATLAWALTSSSTDNVPPLPGPTPVAEAGAIAAEICRCLSAVRSTLATAAAGTAVVDSSGVNWSSGTTFPLDEASLASVSQLLAAALGRSYAVSVSAVPAAAQGASSGEAVVTIPAVRSEVGSLVLCVFTAVKSVRPEVLEQSPGLLSALSPMLSAVLDLPASSEGNILQSSLLNAWNATFGNLNLKPPTASAGTGAGAGAGDERTAWQKAFRPSLLRRLSQLSQRKRVKLPSGITLPPPSGTAPSRLPAAANVDEPSRRRDGWAYEQKESALGGEEGDGETSAQSAAVGELRAAAAGMGRGQSPQGFAGNGGVAGVLSGEGARRSFLRTAASSSPPSRALATPKKMSASPTSRAGSTGSGGSADKFVRVVGSGRGSASRTPTRRAAVTTHTALDGSQAMNPWEGDSQLPDTDPDSAPHLALENEEGLAVPPPPKSVLPPPSTPSTPSSDRGASSTCSTASTTSPEGTGVSPGKRALEDAESETVDPTKTTTPPCGAVAPGDAGMPSPPAKAADRRVRPKITADSDGGAVDSSDKCQSDKVGVGGGSCAGTAAATAAAAAKAAQEARTHATMLAIARADAQQRSREVETGCEGCEGGETLEMTPSSRAPSTGQGVEVDALLQDVRSLAQRVEAARSALSPEQLQEVGSLLQKIVHR